jgi:hypothetical protein
MITTRFVRSTLLFIILSALPVDSFSQEYVLIGWNDLGMHCSNQNFSKVVVLPPYNNVSAQLIEHNASGQTQLVTSGYTIEYSIPNNTYSVGKTDFWTYAQQLFGLGSPLPANIGLTGNGLTGVLAPAGSHFTATGIPLTPFADSDHVHEAPFQLIHLVAKRNSDGAVLATTDAVIPVSNEVGCVQSGCHASESSILNAHEDVSGFNRNGPVLCASCHASNALGTTGIPEARPFSYRMHERHREVAGASGSIATCYKCHPGPNTQCLRDIMGKNPVSPLVCQNCHGTMDTVALSINAGRRPWLDEPKCGTCHGSNYAEEPGKLFRQSTGHGGLFCSACHGSPHAILPTIEANDNIQNVRLQGYAGTLGKCSVCHETHQTGPGPHGIMDTTVVEPPGVAVLLSPIDGVTGVTTLPTLQWQPTAGAQSYSVEVSGDSLFTLPVWADSGIAVTWTQPPVLGGGQTFYWRVMARNSIGSGGWSPVWSFTTANGTTGIYAYNRYWNLVSIPAIPDNPLAVSLFPSAVSASYAYDPLAGYAARESLSVGTGYWIRFDRAQSVALTGVPVIADTVGVAEGWNLIGSVSDPVPWGAVQTVPPGIVSSMPFGYDGGYSIADSIRPGHGYWVKASGPGQIVLSQSPATPQPLALRAAPAVDFITLTVTDAAGRSGKLFVTDRAAGRAALTMYEMPPVPPPGAFDARFASGLMAESPANYPVRGIGVRVSTMAYPVTLAWDPSSAGGNLQLNIGGEVVNMGAGGRSELPGGAAVSIALAGTSDAIPVGYVLEQNRPNPFNPSTTISYLLPEESRVSLGVYNTLGKLVGTIVNREESAGAHSESWAPDNLPSGVYFYRLEAISVSDPSKSALLVRKMLLMK